jgi:hypothetical protein
MFGLYAIIAIVMSQTVESDEAVGIVGGIMAYAFLMVVGLLFLLDRRRRSRPDVAAVGFLRRHPDVTDLIGRPVAAMVPPGQDARAAGAAQANLHVALRGPRGEAEADVVMARLRGGWEVLRADLVVDGGRTRLSGPAATP